MTRFITIAITLALVGPVAHAQTDGEAQPAGDASGTAGAAEAAPDGAVRECVAVAKENAKQMQSMCFEAMHHDPELLALCKNEWSQDYMEQDARKATRNKKHVVAAYASLWIIVVVFLVVMWSRQRKLMAEIDRLERDLKKALDEED